MSGAIKERRSLDLIIQEICMTCISQGLNTTEAMAKYAVSIVTLDPIFTAEKHKPHSLIFRITEHAVAYIMSMKGIKLRLLLAQAYYAEEYKNEDQVVDQHRRLLNLYAEPLLKHVIIYDRAHPDHTMVLRQIVLLTIIMTGMGDPTSHPIFKEAEAAVMSVMSTKDVVKYVHLSQFKKRRQLQEIIKLVTGIRMYNRARCDVVKPGTPDDIDDLPKLLVSSISTMQSMVEETLSDVTRSTTNLERALSECFEWDLKSANMLNYSKPTITDDEYDYAKNLLSLWQQVSLILKTVLDSISRNLLEQLKSEDEMRNKILTMIDKLSCKVGVPSNEVFPDFLELFQHWKGFQNRLVLVNEYNKMLTKMKEYVDVSDIPFPVLRAIKNEYWLLEESAELLSQESISLEVILPTDHDSSPQLEFSGFCPVWFTLAEGLLLRGNTDMGVIRYFGKCYAFRDRTAATLFSRSPDVFISKVFTFGRQNPEYIDILGLRAGLKTHGWGTGGWSRQRRQFKRDKLIQTEIHPLPADTNYKYRHSTWELKKDACQLASLRHRVTHSAQTRLSHWKRVVLSQTYETKREGSQTVRNNATNVPKLQNFMFGLRGRPEEVQHLVTLTRPVDEGLKDIVTQESPEVDKCTNRSCLRYGKCECHCVCHGCELSGSIPAVPIAGQQGPKQSIQSVAS